MKLGRKKKPGTDMVPLPRVREYAKEETRQRYDYADMVWRCTCGAMGAGEESAHKHRRLSGSHSVREYVPKEVYDEEYEAHFSEGTDLEASGIWIVVKLNSSTPEGMLGRYYPKQMEAHVVESTTGLQAILDHYEHWVRSEEPKKRSEQDGRYVALDFFTGHRAEALVEAEWRANVDVAEGSHK